MQTGEKYNFIFLVCKTKIQKLDLFFKIYIYIKRNHSSFEICETSLRWTSVKRKII